MLVCPCMQVGSTQVRSLCSQECWSPGHRPQIKHASHTARRGHDSQAVCLCARVLPPSPPRVLLDAWRRMPHLPILFLVLSSVSLHCR